MNNLQKKLQEIYYNTPDNINGIMLGYKYINNIQTDIISIVYNVNVKKPISELSNTEIIPKSLNIDSIDYPTDVIEDSSTIEMVTCYTNYSSDPQILRLQGNPSLLTPLKGGQEIIQFPTNWSAASGGGYNAYLGTMGLIIVDNEDNRVVGLTNAHVTCGVLLQNSDRSLEERDNPYNLYETYPWVDGQFYAPGALVRNGSNPMTIASSYLKRYSPFSVNTTNYIDACVMGFNPQFSNLIGPSSYQIHQPTTVGQTFGYLPFATTTEIDNLLTTPSVLLYSTGRTTGPKGWGTKSSCQLVVDALFLSAGVNMDGIVFDFADLIRYRYADSSNFPVAGGDSGSILLASINGTIKVIGLVFAGNGGSFSSPNPNTHYGFACRIDRVASAMNIRAWDSSYIINNTAPTANIKTVYFDNNPSPDDLNKTINGETYWNIGLTRNSQFDIVN